MVDERGRLWVFELHLLLNVCSSMINCVKFGCKNLSYTTRVCVCVFYNNNNILVSTNFVCLGGCCKKILIKK